MHHPVHLTFAQNVALFKSVKSTMDLDHHGLILSIGDPKFYLWVVNFFPPMINIKFSYLGNLCCFFLSIDGAR